MRLNLAASSFGAAEIFVMVVVYVHGAAASRSTCSMTVLGSSHSLRVERILSNRDRYIGLWLFLSSQVLHFRGSGSRGVSWPGGNVIGHRCLTGWFCGMERILVAYRRVR